jgi:hypothetical protein
MKARRLPAGPLLAAIDRHPRVRRSQWGWRTRLEQYAGKGGMAAYRQAARTGWVTLRSLEGLCDAFGWHPRELYGDAYDHAALAGRSPDFDPWKGVA